MSLFKVPSQSFVAAELFATAAAHEVVDFRLSFLLDGDSSIVLYEDFGEVHGCMRGEASGRQLVQADCAGVQLRGFVVGGLWHVSLVGPEMSTQLSLAVEGLTTNAAICALT